VAAWLSWLNFRLAIIREQFVIKCADSVFHFGIDRLHCFSGSLDEPNYGATSALRLRWGFCPDLVGLINCDVIPYEARAIMLSHRMGERSI
jgi:hypothetical protein